MKKIFEKIILHNAWSYSIGRFMFIYLRIIVCIYKYNTINFNIIFRITFPGHLYGKTHKYAYFVVNIQIWGRRSWVRICKIWTRGCVSICLYTVDHTEDNRHFVKRKKLKIKHKPYRIWKQQNQTNQEYHKYQTMFLFLL